MLRNDFPREIVTTKQWSRCITQYVLLLGPRSRIHTLYTLLCCNLLLFRTYSDGITTILRIVFFSFGHRIWERQTYFSKCFAICSVLSVFKNEYEHYPYFFYHHLESMLLLLSVSGNYFIAHFHFSCLAGWFHVIDFISFFFLFFDLAFDLRVECVILKSVCR